MRVAEPGFSLAGGYRPPRTARQGAAIAAVGRHDTRLPS